MRPRGVLKFVDQQMLHTLIQPHQHARVFQRRMCGDAGFGEVDPILLHEDDAELRNGMAKNDKDAAHGAPLFFAVGRGRNLPHVTEFSQQRVVTGDFG